MSNQAAARAALASFVQRELQRLEGIAESTRRLMGHLADFERELGSAVRELQTANHPVSEDDKSLAGPVRDLMKQLGPAKELLTQSEVAERLGVSRTTLWKMRREGRLPPAIRISERKLAFRRQDFEDWMREGGIGRSS